MEWWVTSSGQNLLRGWYTDTGDPDPNNPPELSDEDIFDFLIQHADARASFDRLYDTLRPEEQTRLLPLRQRSEVQKINPNISDERQRAHNLKGAANAVIFSRRR
jgi:hypothetical protein